MTDVEEPCGDQRASDHGGKEAAALAALAARKKSKASKRSEKRSASKKQSKERERDIVNKPSEKSCRHQEKCQPSPADDDMAAKACRFCVCVCIVAHKAREIMAALGLQKPSCVVAPAVPQQGNLGLMHFALHD